MSSRKDKNENTSNSKTKPEKQKKQTSEKQNKKKCQNVTLDDNNNNQKSNTLTESKKKQNTLKDLESKAKNKDGLFSVSENHLDIKDSVQTITNSLLTSDDYISDSDLIVVSETDSISPESNSPSTVPISRLLNSKKSPPAKCKESPVKPQQISSKQKTSQSYNHRDRQDKTSVAAIASNLDIKETDKFTSVESTFSSTNDLSEIEINIENYFPEAEKVADRNTSTIAENLNNMLLINSEEDNSSQNSYLYENSPDSTYSEKCIPFLNKVLNLTNSKEYIIKNQLNIKPIIEPLDFSYDKNNDTFISVIDLSDLRAANNFIKENLSLFQLQDTTSYATTNNIQCDNSGLKSLDSSLLFDFSKTNVNEKDVSKHFGSEDIESDFSFTSCNTNDIQPEFFEECSEKIAESFPDDSSVYLQTIEHDLEKSIFSIELDIGANEICFSNNSESLINENICESPSKISPKVKKKRKKTSWYPKKRKRCQKRNTSDKLDCNEPELSNFMKDVFCDTCDEDEETVLNSDKCLQNLEKKLPESSEFCDKAIISKKGLTTSSDLVDSNASGQQIIKPVNNKCTRESKRSQSNKKNKPTKNLKNRDNEMELSDREIFHDTSTESVEEPIIEFSKCLPENLKEIDSQSEFQGKIDLNSVCSILVAPNDDEQDNCNSDLVDSNAAGQHIIKPINNKCTAESKRNQNNRKNKPTKNLKDQDNEMKLSKREIFHDTSKESVEEPIAESSKCLPENLKEIDSQSEFQGKIGLNSVCPILVAPNITPTHNEQDNSTGKKRKRAIENSKQKCQKKNKLIKTQTNENTESNVITDEIFCDTCDEENMEESVNHSKNDHVNHPEFASNIGKNYVEDYINDSSGSDTNKTNVFNNSTNVKNQERLSSCFVRDALNENNITNKDSCDLSNCLLTTKSVSNIKSEIQKEKMNNNDKKKKKVKFKNCVDEREESLSETNNICDRELNVENKNSNVNMQHPLSENEVSNLYTLDNNNNSKSELQKLKKKFHNSDNKEYECTYSINDDFKEVIDPLDAVDDGLFKNRDEDEQLELKKCTIRLERLEEYNPYILSNINLIAKDTQEKSLSETSYSTIEENFNETKNKEENIDSQVSQTSLLSNSVYSELVLSSKIIRKNKDSSKNCCKICKQNSDNQAFLCVCQTNKSLLPLSPKKTFHNVTSPSKVINVVKNISLDSENSDLMELDSQNIKIYSLNDSANNNLLAESSETVPFTKDESNSIDLRNGETKCSSLKKQASKSLKGKSKINLDNESNVTHNIEDVNESSAEHNIQAKTASQSLLSQEPKKKNLISQSKNIPKSKKNDFKVKFSSSEVSIPLKYIECKSRNLNIKKQKNSVLCEEGKKYSENLIYENMEREPVSSKSPANNTCKDLCNSSRSITQDSKDLTSKFSSSKKSPIKASDIKKSKIEKSPILKSHNVTDISPLKDPARKESTNSSYSGSANSSSIQCKSISCNDNVTGNCEIGNTNIYSSVILQLNSSEEDTDKSTTLSASNSDSQNKSISGVMQKFDNKDLSDVHQKPFSLSVSPTEKIKNKRCSKNQHVPVSSVNTQDYNPCESENSGSNKSEQKVKLNVQKREKSSKVLSEKSNHSGFLSSDSCNDVQTETSSSSIVDNSHNVNNLKRKFPNSSVKDSTLKSTKNNIPEHLKIKLLKKGSELSCLDHVQNQTVTSEEKSSKISSEKKKSANKTVKSSVDSKKKSESKPLKKTVNVRNKIADDSKETDLSDAGDTKNKNNSKFGFLKNNFEFPAPENVENKQCTSVSNCNLFSEPDKADKINNHIVESVEPDSKSSSKNVEIHIDQKSKPQVNHSHLVTESSNIDKKECERICQSVNEDVTNDTVILSAGPIFDEDLDFEPDQTDNMSDQIFNIAVVDVSKNSLYVQPVSELNSFGQQFISMSNKEQALNKDSNKIAHVNISDLDGTSCSDSKAFMLQSQYGKTQETNNKPHLSYLNNFKTVPQFSSEDESDSDQEHSFKRSRAGRIRYIDESSSEVNENASNSKRKRFDVDLENQHFTVYDIAAQNSSHDNDCNVISNFSESPDNQIKLRNSTDITVERHPKSEVPTDHVPHLRDLVIKIKDYCVAGSIIKAVEIAEKYIRISESSKVKVIIKVLFSGLLAFFQKLDKQNNDLFDINIFDQILQFLNEFNIYDKYLLSDILTKCCSHSALNIYSKKIFHICQSRKIPLNTEAINIFGSLLKSEETSLPDLLDFIEYVKLICSKKIPKELMHLSIKKCQRMYKFSDADRICKLLFNITFLEIDSLNLHEFLQLCLQKGMWQYIAHMFIKWDPQKNLSHFIYNALIADYPAIGKNFTKLADSIYDSGEISSHHINLLGHIGTALMISNFCKCNYPSAVDVLYTLHRHNVNYFELQLEACKSFGTNLDKDLMIFPFFVAFIAVDICLHFNKPKDAFIIFQGFGWITPDEKLDGDVKIYVIKERFQRLLNLVKRLRKEETLNEGWEALKGLLSIVEQDFSVEDLKKDVHHVEGLQSVYNDYLVSFLNSNKISSVHDLYQHSCGPCKEIFNISPSVLRGLIVEFSKNGYSEEANSLFMLGIIKKVYSIEKPQAESFPWNLIIITYWTIHEIKLVVEWFLNYLFPILTSKPKNTDFEKWFSIKISFKETKVPETRLECLKETIGEEDCMQKTLSALENMEPSLEAIQKDGKNDLYLNPDSVYNFWKYKCPSLSPKVACLSKDFLVSGKKGIAFGRESDTSSEVESHLSVDQWNSKSKVSDESIMQSPKCNSAKNIVSGMIGEIRSNLSKYPITSPIESPSRTSQSLFGVSNILKLPLPVCPNNDMCLSSPEQTRRVQNSVELPSDSKFIQTSTPCRLLDIGDNGMQTLYESMPFKNASPSQVCHENLNHLSKSSTDFQISPLNNSNNYQRVNSASPSNRHCLESEKNSDIIKPTSPAVCSSINNTCKQEKFSSNFLTNREDGEKDDNVTSSINPLSNLTAQNISQNKVTLKSQTRNRQTPPLLSRKKMKRLKTFALKKITSLTGEQSQKLKNLPKHPNSQSVSSTPKASTIKQVPRKLSKKQKSAMKSILCNNSFQNLTVSFTSNTSVRTISTSNLQNAKEKVLPSIQNVDSDTKSCHNGGNVEISVNDTKTNLNPKELLESKVQTKPATNKIFISEAKPCNTNNKKNVFSGITSGEKSPRSSTAIRKKITYNSSANNTCKQGKASNFISTSLSRNEGVRSVPAGNVKIQLKPSTSADQASHSSSSKIINLNPAKKHIDVELKNLNSVSDALNISNNERIKPLQRTTENMLKPPNVVNKTSDCVSSSNKVRNLVTFSKTIKVQLNSSNFTSNVLESSSSNNTEIPQRNLKSPHKPTKPVIKRNFSCTLPSEIPKCSVPEADSANSSSQATSQVTTAFRRNVQTVHMRETCREVTVDSSKVTGSSCDAVAYKDEVFTKVIQFLKIKVKLKYKNLPSHEQHRRAVNLAQNFLKHNDATLDKRTMKLLTEFAESHV